VPIKYNGAVREVLSLAFPEDRPVRPRDLNSTMVLASQTAGHLENAMLHEHIRAGSDRMRAILNSTRDGILLIDRNGFLVDCNPSAERLLGIDKEEFLGKHFVLTLSRVTGGEEVEGLGYSRSQLVALARQLRLEPERITSRQFSRVVGAQQMYIEEIGSPVLNDRSEIVGRLLVLRDITEQKQLEAYRDEITHMAVHDLRGPLWAVISGINLVQEDLALLPQSDMTRKTLDVAAQSANGLLKLVDSLLDISKLESRQMPLQRAPVSVEELISAAVGSLSGSLEEANIDLQVDLDPDLTPLNIDPVIIRRVLVNLLDNALRHTPAAGKILVSARRSGSEVVIRVADSGPGIPADERDRIFERFRQVKANIPLRGPKGSGLGLTFCKLAVEAHEGRIWVDPEGPLSGACIALSLPMVAVPTPTTVPS
jgi:NtrC-family two-component system sensor histidine kinase KinB